MTTSLVVLFSLTELVSISVVKLTDTILFESGVHKSPHVVIECAGDSPKGNVFCTISHRKVYGPFLFAQNTLNAAYLDMLENWLIPQLQQDMNSYIFQ